MKFASIINLFQKLFSSCNHNKMVGTYLIDVFNF